MNSEINTFHVEEDRVYLATPRGVTEINRTTGRRTSLFARALFEPELIVVGAGRVAVGFLKTIGKGRRTREVFEVRIHDRASRAERLVARAKLRVTRIRGFQIWCGSLLGLHQMTDAGEVLLTRTTVSDYRPICKRRAGHRSSVVSGDHKRTQVVLGEITRQMNPDYRAGGFSLPRVKLVGSKLFVVGNGIASYDLATGATQRHYGREGNPIRGFSVDAGENLFVTFGSKKGRSRRLETYSYPKSAGYLDRMEDGTRKNVEATACGQHLVYFSPDARSLTIGANRFLATAGQPDRTIATPDSRKIYAYECSADQVIIETKRESNRPHSDVWVAPLTG